MNSEQLKYPIGKYSPSKELNRELLDKWINGLAEFPKSIENLTAVLSHEELNWRYRPDGWTIKQVVHHCADSHMNALIRFKLALTEETPIIRPYFENKWATLIDSLDDDIMGSLLILKGVHKKWVTVLKNLSDEQLKFEFIHPEHIQKFNLARSIDMYAWHANHHLAHIKRTIELKGKYN